MHTYDAHGLPYFISSSGVIQFQEVCYTVVSYAPYLLLHKYTITNLATFGVTIFWFFSPWAPAYFLYDSAEGRRMTVEIISWSISMKVWDRAGIELATPVSPVRHASVARHVTGCATRCSCVNCDVEQWQRAESQHPFLLVVIIRSWKTYQLSTYQSIHDFGDMFLCIWARIWHLWLW